MKKVKANILMGVLCLCSLQTHAIDPALIVSLACVGVSGLAELVRCCKERDGQQVVKNDKSGEPLVSAQPSVRPGVGLDGNPMREMHR